MKKSIPTLVGVVAAIIALVCFNACNREDGPKYCRVSGCAYEVTYTKSDYCFQHKCINSKCINKRAIGSSHCSECIERSYK